MIARSQHSEVAAAGRRTSTRLDPYVARYAARTHGMTASEIRALFSVASRPEVVSLAGGMPNISGLPLDTVADSLHDLTANHGTVAMQYGSGQGDPALREQICAVMRLEGIDAHPDDVCVTVGSQQAVDLVTRIFCDPGDVVLVEAPSYVGALGVFRAYECDVVHVETDDDGLVPDALRQAVRLVRQSGRRIKLVYTVPNFQNPAGVTLSASRRREILQLSAELGLLVLEDNPYGLLGFSGEPLGALRADDADRVIYLGRSRRPSLPAFGSGGCSHPMQSARSWCWRRSPRRCARPRSPNSRSLPIWPPATGKGRSSSSRRCTANGVMRC
jgi:DNA-binding transcriptional MocR family regulator